MKRLLLLITLPLSLCGCLGMREAYDVYCRSYVMSYYDVDGIVLTADNKYSLISIYNRMDGWIGTYKDEGEKKVAYDALCEKHGDMTFNQTITILPGGGGGPYPGIDYISIEIKSDADFDDRHTAGGSLADIVAFLSVSAKPYIDKGYVKYARNSTCYPLEKLVIDIMPADLTLAGSDGFVTHTLFEAVVSHFGELKFQSQPTLSKTHTFTVTMTADDGRVFEASIEMTFE